MTFPRNEAETIELFRLLQNRFGWRIIKSQKNAFPDAVIENADGLRLNCEFEFEDKNFRKHGHPLDGSCDIIVCWRQKWETPPLPVLELCKYAKHEAKFLERLLANYVPYSEFHQACRRIEALERLVKTRDDQLRGYERGRERLFHLGNLFVLITCVFVIVSSIPVIVGSFNAIISSLELVFGG